MSELTVTFDHPIWQTIVGLVVGYGILLAIVFLAFFIVPYLLFL
ncbi:hypothetical protein [Halanaeroarchaeum sp. HSR-CO]|nr:hypothetical protein [Halanaeroarchaeum sp. HSR-CO]